MVRLFRDVCRPHLQYVFRIVLKLLDIFLPECKCLLCKRRYEVLQFCWLSPEQRATAEEVHRLLVYLRMQGQKDMEEDFEQRWDTLKPNPSGRQSTISHTSFPILEQFADDAMRQEIDEVLTVTETSKGLSFEYVWEAAKHDHYDGSHGRSDMDTTLNYHSMFFPVSSEDIRAHFPEPEVRTAGNDGHNSPSGIPGIVQVFDAQKPSEFRDYYIQLEEQGESIAEEDGNRRDFLLDQQDFVHLQDVRLDESSTEAEFFHQSIDSKDSYLPDSHIWSSLENDSPYHTNIFTDGGTKQEESPSWRTSFMEFSERNGNSFHKDGEAHDLDTRYGGPFLGEDSEAPHLVDSLRWKEENTDVKMLLNTEKLAENFMFLKNQSLMKDRAMLSSPQENFLSPGVAHEPEDAFKMGSWDNLNTLGSFATAGNYLKPSASSTSASQECSDSPGASLGELHPSAVEHETLVPFITVVAEEEGSIQLPVTHSSSSEDLGLARSSDRGTDSGFDSTSERFEIVICQDGPTDALSESAPPDLLRTDADLSGLEDDLGASTNTRPGVNQMLSSDGDGEDRTSNILVSELIGDEDLSDHEESLMDTNGRSSLLVSGPSLDQISQDSLLEDSMSTNLATVDNSVETPDSLDSLDIHRLGEQAEELSAQTIPHKLQPPYKISDSGYETENLESPEWNSQLNIRDHSPVKNCSSIAKKEEPEDSRANANVVPPEIIISKAEGVLSSQSELVQPEVPAPVEEPLMGGHYRDSAYFSDNDSEPEKKPEETLAGGSGQPGWLRNSDDAAGGAAGGGGKGVQVEKDLDTLLFGQGSLIAAEAQRESEELVGESLLEADFSEKEPTGSYRPQDEERLIDLDLRPAAAPFRPSSELASHPKLTRTHARKEPDMEGRFLARREDSGLDGHEDGVDADEEDENSEDSEDDIHAYQLHSSSSESEDETAHAVPIIVSDDSSAKNLKSLLKASTLRMDALSPEGPARSGADSSRKAVSFFDDVTVFLFDQVKCLCKAKQQDTLCDVVVKISTSCDSGDPHQGPGRPLVWLK